MRVETGTAKILRDHANKVYGDHSLHMTAIILRGAADTIDRLTQERNEALEQVQKLLTSKINELSILKDGLFTQMLKSAKRKPRI